jgi:hypothetical protein
MTNIQLKITLKEIDPPIWRRVLVSPETTLLQLHDIIQYTFGWTESHLFLFEVGSMEFVHYPDWKEDAYRFQAAEMAQLGEIIPTVIPVGGHFNYIYDMGDHWEHEICVEKTKQPEKGKSMPVCVGGQRACPPEDVGGSIGYCEFLKVIQDPESEDRDVFLTWVGGEFDPEAFDITATNRGLKKYLRNCKLIRASSWQTHVPTVNPNTAFSSDWTRNISSEHQKIAESLPFRRDTVTLMEYLQNNKVKGTKALGNFPLKHIRRMTAGFVNPPVLDNKYGDRVFKLQSEDDVQELVFLHVFANSTGLVLGGEQMVWKVSFYGKMFLDRAPEEQVWFLTKNWFEYFNWLYCYRYDNIAATFDYPGFEKLVFKLLLSYPDQEPIDVAQIIQDFDDADPEWIEFTVAHNSEYYKERFLKSVVIVPFEKLGLIEVVRQESIYKSLYNIKQIMMTNYGRTLMSNFG